MKVTIDREMFHQMMRSLAGGIFATEQWNTDLKFKINRVAEKLANETAVRSDKKVEIDV